MNRGREQNQLAARLVATVVFALAVGTSPVSAALVNKYTFNNNNANDSVGGAHGVVVDNTGISRFTGGAIDLSGNNGAGSNQDFSLPTTVGAFVDLPNGVFTSAVNGGTFGAVTLEIWFTTQQNRGWAEAYAFGTSTGGEGMSNAGDSYVALIPQSGTATPDFRATTRDGGAALETPVIGSPTPLPVGVRHHVVYALDHNDTDGGANPDGTGRLYHNGMAVGSAQIATFLDVLPDNNNWLGRSQWPDPLYDGSIDEFRIYDHALSATEVTQSFTMGPEPAPLPALLVNRDTGAISLSNPTSGNVQIKGYSIASAAGSLDPATWTSIDAGNAFDPDGTWTAQSSLSTNLAESVTGGNMDGGTLAPSASRSVGTPWVKTPFEDLVFGFTLGDDSTGFGLVQYTGMSLTRSDLNGDGAVNVADWSLFLPNSFTTFTSDTAVAAYRKGDLDGDLDNDFADFQLFKADFIAANGAAAFAELSGAVPEPASVALAAIALSIVALRQRRTRYLLVLIAAGFAAMAGPREAAAALAHRYSFTSDANDSVGTAHGTVVDIGAPTAVFANGQLDLTANAGQGSNNITEDAYVDLPNDIISSAASGGPNGAFSFELWATVATTRTWQRFIDVGTSNGGEDVSDGGQTAPYIYIAANHGRFANGVGTEVHAPDQAGPATETGQAMALPNGIQQHIVATYERDDTSSGPDGTMRLYRNGIPVGAAAIPPNIDLDTFTNNNNWLGRSQWPDPVFDGSFNEFRIYDHALTASEVTTNAFFGPDTVGGGELPSLTVNTNTGQITMTNSTTANLSIEFYRISSAGSALNVAGWNSLDDQNYDAVDGPDAGTVAGDSDGEGWDEAGGSNAMQLVELFLGEAGSSFAPSEALNLGNAFNTSVFGPGNNGDLQFTLGLLGGAQFDLNVNYVSGPAGVLGDYNNNGTVDAADYVLWRNGGPLQNEGVTPGMTTADDYTFWRSRFGAMSGSGAGLGAAAVPEPTACLLLVVFATAAMLGRHRKLFH